MHTGLEDGYRHFSVSLSVLNLGSSSTAKRTKKLESTLSRPEIDTIASGTAPKFEIRGACGLKWLPFSYHIYGCIRGG